MYNPFEGEMNKWLMDDTLHTIQRLAVVAEYRDRGGAAHIMRIGQYCHMMAERLGMDEEQRQALFYASMLHDLGKLAIPLHILLKPSRLTAEEFDVMKTHTIAGRKMLSVSNSEFMRAAERVILTHHEKWNGSGYPNGLMKDEIPLEGRLVHLADQYDALRSKRPYKSSCSHMKTFKTITEGDGRTMPEHFDPELMRLFVEIHEEFDRIYQNYTDETG